MDLKRAWPKKRWKKIVFVSLVSIIILSFIVSIFLYEGINSDFISEIIIVNEQGTANGFFIYHPGFSLFTKDVSYAYSEGLELNDWRIVITTVSDNAPINISEYDLLILASPVYGGAPSPTIKRYVDRIGDLEETETVIIVTAAGSPGNTVQTMQEIIEQNNGINNSNNVLFSGTPNEGNESAIDLSKIAGSEIFP